MSFKSKAKDASGSPNIPPDMQCYAEDRGVITTTTNDIAGFKVVKQMGTIYGITVRARNWGVDIGALLKSSIGGEIRPFTTMLYEARSMAMDRMCGEAIARGGNAVLAVRFDVVAQGAFSQVACYGTAALVEEIKSNEE
ncbi:Hypothetical protein R9X50_00072000 [Acrodontium crateriforme]|uniref:Uncharacterized protein n=1 Tax=Acrodontium crateriforme TaxID=150365 RepID=A0AAQ3M0S7_9PEZI|nr:Hypothetical protein R9X50_00072000 [Acrodontium crateriforme]